MAAFDPFGLKKELPPAIDAPADEAAHRPGLSRRAWLGLAAADVLLVLACGVFLAMRVKGRLSAAPVPPSKRAGGKPVPKPAEAKPAEGKPADAKPAEPKPEVKKPETKPEPETKKPEPPKHEAKKPEPPKHESKKPVAHHEEEPKGPVGSPAVNAEPLPQRKVSPAGGPASPAKPGGRKRLTRPVPFTYDDSSAKEVYLVGPFLVRTGGRKTLFKDTKGAWQTTIYLNIGQTYKYRFEVVSPSGAKKLTPAQKVEVLDGD